LDILWVLGHWVLLVPTSRETFLKRVREAVQAGNRPGSTAPIQPRGDAGYQGAGADPVNRFCEELTAAGGIPHVVGDERAALTQVQSLVQAKAARNVLLGKGALLDRLPLSEWLRDQGIRVTAMQDLPRDAGRDVFFEADLGISGADFLVAETGSIVIRARPEEPRSLSLLPRVHIVVAERTQLVPDLFDVFAVVPIENSADGPTVLPSAITVITGPSKTGDIELRLVTGVHGPGEVHVVLINR
jgi:L-lactate utilization protein LutC